MLNQVQNDRGLILLGQPHFFKDSKMKFLIASDIHGSASYCHKLLERFNAENADRLFLLGDILYHGPRNDLPEGYNPKEVISMLNPLKEKIFCVRGNCDTEVDQMVLEFPILADYAILENAGHIIYATHGHIYGEKNPPMLHKGDILLNGHTHIPAFKEYQNFTYINPGSVSIPKENSHHGYILLENNIWLWKDLDGKTVRKENLN